MTENVDNQVDAAEDVAIPSNEAADTSIAETRQEMQALQDELAGARREAAEAQDRYLRTRADMENFKKRMERTYAGLASSSKKDLLKKLLGVRDNLERALQFGNASNGAGESIIEGVRLTQYQLDQLLAQEGVKRIEAEGKQFDPTFEEALQSVDDPSVPDHTVVQIVRNGYTMGDEVLRPAQVIVSVHNSTT